MESRRRGDYVEDSTALFSEAAFGFYEIMIVEILFGISSA